MASQRPDGWHVPMLLIHIFDSESKTVSFGWWLFIVASCGAFLIKEGTQHALNADTWLWCVVLASILVGGKLVSESILEAVELKLGKKPEPKEIKTDAAVPPPPAQP